MWFLWSDVVSYKNLIFELDTPQHYKGLGKVHTVAMVSFLIAPLRATKVPNEIVDTVATFCPT